MSRALELAAAAVAAAAGDEADAFAEHERSGLARFAGSQVHQPTLIENEQVTLRVVRDGRIGCATTNRTDQEGLRQAARRAAEAADSAPPDPGFAGLAPPVPAVEVDGYDEETAALTPADQAALAWSAIEAAPELGLYGYFTSGASEIAVASSTGVSLRQRLTDASILTLAASKQESGFAEATSWKVAELDCAATAREAVAKGLRTGAARELAEGSYRVVLEPYAFSELLWYFALSSFNPLALLEGRSYLSGRLGEQLFAPALTVRDDGRDPRGLPKAFDLEGVPKQPVTLIEGGVAKDVVWDRRTAARAGEGRVSTGHALPAPAQSFGALPFNLSVAPGEATLDELVESVEEGIYVTRLHYLGIVDPREGILTGMTRDGTFRISGGRIGEPLVNLRFTTSFPKLVHDLLGLTRATTLVSRSDYYEERYPFGTLVPGVASGSFRVVASGSSPGL